MPHWAPRERVLQTCPHAGLQSTVARVSETSCCVKSRSPTQRWAVLPAASADGCHRVRRVIGWRGIWVCGAGRENTDPDTYVIGIACSLFGPNENRRTSPHPTMCGRGVPARDAQARKFPQAYASERAPDPRRRSRSRMHAWKHAHALQGCSAACRRAALPHWAAFAASLDPGQAFGLSIG